MRKLLLGLLLSFSVLSNAQNYTNGYHFPTDVDLHIPIIFVEYNNQSDDPGTTPYFDTDALTGSITTSLPLDFNDEKLINSSLANVSHQNFNISSFYSIMSFGKMNLTGKVYNIQLPGNYQDIEESESFIMNQWVFQMISEGINVNDELAQFDNFTNRDSNERWQNIYPPIPDQIIDYFVIIHKRPKYSGAAADWGFHPIYGSNYAFRHGHWQKSGRSKPYLMTTFFHELSHNQIANHHYASVNGVFGNKFQVTGGHGMMCNPNCALFTASADDMYKSGWLSNSDNDTNNFNNFIDINKQNYLVNFPNGIVPNLSDMLSEPTGNETMKNRAIRIEYPYSNQVLWIENHQSTHPSGFGSYTNVPSPSDWIPNDQNIYTEKGVYIYTSGSLNNLNNPPSDPLTTEGTNSIHYYHPMGRYDYHVSSSCNFTPVETTYASISDTGCELITELGGVTNTYAVFQGEENPFSGTAFNMPIRMNDLAVLSDPDDSVEEIFHNIEENSDSNNETEGFKCKIENGYTERIIQTEITFKPGDLLGINGITPISNQRTFNDNINVQRQDPYILNGLSVEILEASSGDPSQYDIKVSFNDWTLNTSKRWCEFIELPEQETLTINDGIILTLDLSGTANRETIFKDRGDPYIMNFVNPTELKIKSNASLNLSNFACVIIKRESDLILEENAALYLAPNAYIDLKNTDSEVRAKNGATINLDYLSLLKVSDNSRLILESGSSLSLANNSKIEIESGGELVINTDNIELNGLSANIVVKNGGKLTTTNNTKFNFENNGKLVVEEGGIIDIPFELSGLNNNHVAIDLKTNAQIQMNERNFKLSNCKVNFETGAQIEIQKSEVEISDVNFEEITSPTSVSTAFKGLELNSFTCENSSFNRFQNGIFLNSFNTPCPNFIINKNIFVDILAKSIEAVDVYSIYVSENTISNNNIILNQIGISISNSIFNSILNNVSNQSIGVYNNGCSIAQLNGDVISECNIGLSIHNQNTRFDQCSAIVNCNSYGIYSVNQSNLAILSLGESGGCKIINSGIGINATNLLIEMDALDNATSTNSWPNDLSQNDYIFDLSYTVTPAPTGLSARGNFWGDISGCGASLFDFNSNLPTGFVIDDEFYESVAPLNCLASNNTCTPEGLVSNNGNSSIKQIYGIAQSFMGHGQFPQARYGYALLDQVKQTSNYSLLELNDRDKVDISSVLINYIDNEISTNENCLVERTVNLSSIYPKLEFNDYAIINDFLSVFPNPFSDQLRIELNSNKKFKLEIVNINGNIEYSIDEFKFSHQIETGILHNGIYLLKVVEEKTNRLYTKTIHKI